MEEQQKNIQERQKEWQKKAYTLFFVEKKSIVETAETLHISRKSIAKFLKEQPEYFLEKERRKDENKNKRRQYQREWDRKNRSGRYRVINAETLRKEHDMAAFLLSKEKF